MDLRQLNALVAVAEHGSFSAAADALSTVQSNVSSHVAHLEKEVGATLVDRAAGRLTDEGRAVVDRARRIAAELDALRADVASLGHDVVGDVRLGVIGTAARWLVPPLLDEMRARHPKVRLVVVEATSTSLEPQLANGSLDLAVVNLPTPGPGPELACRSLFDEDMVLVVPAGHPLADGMVSVADLAGLELLLPPPGTAFRRDLDAAAAAAGVTLTARAELDGVRLIASLTFEGYGPAVLPATAIPSWLEGAWVKTPVVGLARRRVGLARRRRGLPSAPARALHEVLEAVVRSGIARRPDVHAPAAAARS